MNLLSALLWICTTVALCPSNAYTREELRSLPEEVRFAANIENNFVVGGFRTVLNWTARTLGKPEDAILKQCTRPTYQGKKLCAKVPMPTPWSANVDPAAPLPEYPRPQQKRDRWMNLNGIWTFKSRGVMENNGSWDDVAERRIVVPFPVEAPLSGIATHDANNAEMLYFRKFSVPSEWTGKGNRVILHFDAVDHTATVYINGKAVGSHAGGCCETHPKAPQYQAIMTRKHHVFSRSSLRYDRFSFDITDRLREGVNELAVRAFDPTEFAHIPIGKQRLHPPRHPSSIWYTSTSGIWQTVWLEPVPAAHIKSLEMIPKVDSGALQVTVHGSKAASGAAVKAVVSVKGRQVAAAEGTVGKAFDIKLKDVQLWSPEQPFLYDLGLSLQPQLQAKASAAQLPGRTLLGDSESWSGERGAASRRLNADEGDHIRSYFAMRKSNLGRARDGSLRPLLNNEFVFQTGKLDQGFWPDGLYTPASDEALIYDLQLAKDLGFNMLRKHTKVESDRWYYHADRLGVLVWQDMPSMFYQSGEQELSQKDKENFKSELEAIMMQHINSPSIVAWVIFNEGWGQHDTVQVVEFAQKLDQSRIFDAASGWTDKPVGDLVDRHDYVGPGSPLPTESRSAVLGEFGGLGLRVEGHMWIPDDAFAYEMQKDGKQLQERFSGLAAQLEVLMLDAQYNLSAAVYTEVADVEAEINGWVTYDRQVVKVDKKVLAKANRHLISRSKRLGSPGLALSSSSRERVKSANISKLKKTAGKSKAKVFASERAGS